MRTWLGRWHNLFGRTNGTKELFKGAVGASIFFYKLYQLQHKDPKKRPSLVSILEIFTSAPHEMELPDCCFRYEI
jgi:hypothetical protein